VDAAANLETDAASPYRFLRDIVWPFWRSRTSESKRAQAARCVPLQPRMIPQAPFCRYT
jgi:hypothetical protein